MSKLTKAQSRTGKLLMEPNVIEGKADDKTEEHGLRADRGPDTIKKGRKKPEREHFITKRGKRPDGDSGKRGKSGKSR